MKVVVSLITNIPTPYRLGLWDEIKHRVDLHVICLSKSEKNRQWLVNRRDYIFFLKSYNIFFRNKDWSLHFTLPFSLFLKLLKRSPDIIIMTGYDSPQYWEALLYAKLFSKKKVFWNGSTLHSSRSNKKLVNVLKHYFINSFDSFYTYGSEASKYILSFGVNKNKIITGINTIDSSFYKKNTSNTKNITKELNFLYVGQLIERKGLKNTIEAFSKLRRRNWILTIVGAGRDEIELRHLVKDYKLDHKIKFEGFKQKEVIVTYYSNADIFIMPSFYEVWGLVLNEALASGLFCLSSKYAGATYDLINDGENGFIIDPLNINNIVDNIKKVFEINLTKESIKNKFNVSYAAEAKKIVTAIRK